MTDPQQPQPVEPPEQPSVTERTPQHDKKMRYVALVMLCLLVAALTISTVTELRKSTGATSTENPSITGTSQTAQPTPTFEQLAKNAPTKTDSATQPVDQTKQLKECVKNPETCKKPPHVDVKDNASKQAKTADEIRAEFFLAETRRVLDAARTPIGRAASKNQPTVGNANANATSRPDQITSTPPEDNSVDPQINEAKEQLAQLNKMFANLTSGQVPSITSPQDVTKTGNLMPQTTSTTGLPRQPNTSVGESSVIRNKTGTSRTGPAPGEYVIQPGTIIITRLRQDVSSDYPGKWLSTVARDVMDLKTDTVLIPRGTVVIGNAMPTRGPNEAIQRRLAMPALFAYRPDGKQIDLSNQQSMDYAGIAALEGGVDYHIAAQMLGIGAYALIGLGPSSTLSNDQAMSARDTATAEIASGIRTQAKPAAARYLAVVPTVNLAAGQEIGILITSELYVTPWVAGNDIRFTR